MKGFNYDSLLVQENLERVLEMGTLSIYNESKEWYPKAHTKAVEFSEKHNRHLYITAALISVFSPQKEWHHNIKITEDFLDKYDWKVSSYRGHTQTQVKKALNIIQSTDQNEHWRVHWALGGLKTINFWHNILDPKVPEWATIDSHMYQLMTGNMNVKKITPKQYEFLKKELIVFAKKNNRIPSEQQAELWLIFKKNKFGK